MKSAAVLRILISPAACANLGSSLSRVLAAQPHVFVSPGSGRAGDAQSLDADIAFVSRDVTGLSTKHETLLETQLFYNAMRRAPSLRWVHGHAAGADRPIFQELMARGVQVTTSSGANAGVVVQTALAGLLALARGFPKMLAAQRAHVWAPLIKSGLPRDLAGQTAVIVGWGPIGQQLGALLAVLGLHVVAVRRKALPDTDTDTDTDNAAVETVAFEDLNKVLPRADWLVLACPLNERTRELINAAALACLPAGAHLINVARGEIVDEAALVSALQRGKLAGAYLDVFAHEPLPSSSPLWDLPNVMVTPHSAGFSDANAAKVAHMFIDNLARWLAGEQLCNRAIQIE